MTDAELIALAALANVEAVLMAGENALRAMKGNSPAFAWNSWGEYGECLYREIDRRLAAQKLDDAQSDAARDLARDIDKDHLLPRKNDPDE